jgi:hypothetical protein
MKSIIGLLDNKAAVHSTVERLKEAGIFEDRIDILVNTKTINRILGVDPMRVIQKYAFWGAGIGVATYAVCGLLAAFCECRLMHYGQGYGIFAFLGAVLAGTIIGGFLGIAAGAGEAEEDTHLYIQGVSFGGKVIAVQVADAEAERVQDILTKENTLGLKVLQTKGA